MQVWPTLVPAPRHLVKCPETRPIVDEAKERAKAEASRYPSTIGTVDQGPAMIAASYEEEIEEAVVETIIRRRVNEAEVVGSLLDLRFIGKSTHPSS